MRIPLIVSVLILLSGCSHVKFSPAAGLESESFSQRQAPAAVTKESEDSLKKKDYVQIGSISAKESIWTCFTDDCKNNECTNTVQKDLTKDIIATAPDHGGDLIVLQENNKAATNMVEKQGECIFGTNDTYDDKECSGGYGSVPRTCVTIKKKNFVCHRWRTDRGLECSVNSRGTVWRHDPELSKRRAEAERENKKQ